MSTPHPTRLKCRTVVRALQVILTALPLAACSGLATIPDRIVNRVVDPPPYTVSEAARTLHGSLVIGDLHADTMLSPRDIASHGAWGQVDLPRLGEANVAIETFAAAVNKSTCSGEGTCDEKPDLISLLSVASGWPSATHSSYAERAAFMIDRLRGMSAAWPGSRLVSDAEGLAAVLRERRALPVSATRPIALTLGIEGGEAFEGRSAEIERFHRLGVRVVGLVHFFDNEIGGSAHGRVAGGITPFGRTAVAEMERRGMIVDLAHASSPLIADVLALATRPVLVSHTGVQGVCPGRRNLSDADVRAIVQQGGLIAISMFELTLCPDRAQDADEGKRFMIQIVASIAHVARLAGEVRPGRAFDHVAIGGDWDGYVRTPFDVTGLPKLTEALLAHGLPPADIAKVMGGNYCRFLLAELPNAQGSRGVAAPQLCDPQ